MYDGRMIDDSNDSGQPAGDRNATDVNPDIGNEPGSVLHLPVHHALLLPNPLGECIVSPA